MPTFSRGHTCVTFSQRWFAPSSAGAAPDLGVLTDDVEALAGHLGLERMAIVAQSLGGIAGLGYSLRHPERVSALVMSGTTGWIDLGAAAGPVHAESQRLEAALVADAIHPALGRRLALEQPELFSLYLAIDRLGTVVDKPAIRRSNPPPRPSVAEVAALATPILWVFGEEDPITAPGLTGPGAGRLVAQALPQTRLEMLPATGHSPYFERAARFNELVLDFLAANP